MKEKHLTAITLILVAVALVAVSILMAGAFSAEKRGVESPYEDAYFNKSTVNTVNITISDENWQDILANPTAEEYHVCTIEINGDTYQGSAIRTKGQSTLSSLASADTDRYSFKVKADEYVNDQSFNGLNEFCLNNFYQDPTAMKDFLTYDLMEELGVPTPLHSYAAVYLNGEYFGLYLMLESVETDFAARNFGANYGQLYKPEFMNFGGGGGGPGGNMDFKIDDSMKERIQQGMDGGMNREFNMTGFNRTAMRDRMPDFGGMGGGGFGGGMNMGTTLKYVDDSTSSYSNIFDNAVYTTTSTAASKERVVKAIKNLNLGNPADGVEVEECLKFIAGLGSVVSLDSYIGSMCHNYFLYEDDGKLQMIPWDFNNAFGSFMGSDTSSMVNFPIDTPVGSGINLSERPLVEKLLASDEYKEIYHTYMRWVAENYFNDRFGDRVDALEDLIEDYIKTDPTFFYTYEEHLASLPNLKLFGELRGKSILGQLNGTIPSTWDGQKADSANLIDTTGLNMNTLGGMGGGGKGGFGDFGGDMPDFGNMNPQDFMQGNGNMPDFGNMNPQDFMQGNGNMPDFNNMNPQDFMQGNGNMPDFGNMNPQDFMQDNGSMPDFGGMGNMPGNMQRPDIRA
ncbi:MAG TPA: CotH kinase family protein [Methanocorpusculum sp.]|nr:CotH kinase family protein [Methanocorpusculum sp.]